MSANQLIPYAPRALNGETVQTVNARDLHGYLGIAKDYNAWMRQQIKRARLVEGRDFTTYLEVGSSQGGRQRQDYFVTFDAAKHIGMLSNTDKGQEVREYFIACEKALQAKAADLPTSPWDIMAQLVETGRQQEQRLLTLEAQQRADMEARLATQQQTIEALHQAAQANAKADQALDSQQFFTLAEYVYLHGLQRQLPEQGYKEAGLFLTDYCVRRGIPVRKIPVAGKRWEEEHGYHIGTLQQVLPGYMARRFAQTELTVISGGA